MKWKSQRFAYNEALAYVKGRHHGTISSFRTPWPKVNSAGVDGFEWHSMTIIGGRSGTGKTCIKDQIVREAHIHNVKGNMRILEFQFEMLARASKVREFSAVLGKPYKYICSSDGSKITKEDFAKLLSHSKVMTDEEKVPVDIVEEPQSVDEMKEIIDEYMKEYSSTKYDDSGHPIGIQYVNTVVTLDHSYLVKQVDRDGGTEMLYKLGDMLTQLKRKYPIAFIILSQLNRNFEQPERHKEGTYGNYPNASDIFGADALLQHCDMAIIINRPADKFIKYYGPEKYVIDDEDTLVFHFVKCRTGDSRMSFFKAEFDKMRVSEMATPPTKS